MHIKIRNLSGIVLLLTFLIGLTQAGHAAESENSMVRINSTINARIHTFTQIIKPETEGNAEVLPAEISVSYPVFTGRDGAKDIAAAINEAVKQRLLGVNITQNATYKSLDELLASFSDSYKSAMKKTPDDIGAWSLKLEVLIRFSDEDLLSLDIMDSLFSGGAHSLSTITYHVFSLKTGKAISLPEIIPDARADEFMKIAEVQFRKQKNMPKEQKYVDAGFTFPGNKFTLNTNFLIDKKGLQFYYNSFEIAPYGMGGTELLVPWSKLRKIISPESIAGKLLGSS